MVKNQVYRDYCQRHEGEIPLFHQPWWWDAVVGDEQWQGMVTQEKYDNKAAIFPYVKSRKWGFKTIRKPLFTTYSGPFWMGEDRLSEWEKIAMAQRLWPSLLQKLPDVPYLKLMLRPEVQYVTPFEEAGYRTTVRSTYTINFSAPLTEIHAGFRKDVKRKIRKFQGESHCYETEDLSSFFPLIEKVYARQQLTVPFLWEQLRRIFSAARQRGVGRLFMLKNNNQENIGGVLLIFDTNRVYLIVSAVSEEGRQVGAIPVLLWHAIQYFHHSHRKFDFCGSMLSNIAERNRSYGAVREEYWEVERRSKFLNFFN